MASTTPYLPGFAHQLCGGPTRSHAIRAAARAESLDGLAALVAKFIPAELFTPGGGQRKRDFTAWVTFIAFLGQVLTRGSSCREAVRRVQAWCVADRRRVPSQDDSAYCQARKRLPLERLRAAHEEIGRWIDRRADDAQRWCGRSVKGGLKGSCRKSRQRRIEGSQDAVGLSLGYVRGNRSGGVHCERRVGSRLFLAGRKSPLLGSIFFLYSEEKDLLPVGGFSSVRLQWLGPSRR